MKAISRSYRWFWFQITGSEVNRMLTMSMIFSTALVAARMVYTGRFTYLGLVWNLFLAWLPYMMSSWLQQSPVINSKWKFSAAAFVWLLFIPNSFYILTDLFHLNEHNNVPKWYDLALIVSFAWNGLLLGLLSVRQMEKLMEQYIGGRHELFFIYPVMALNALGVYIGRYLRYNSWDIITNPFGLSTDILKMAAHPIHYKYAWGMVACYSVFMTLVYCTIKRIHKAIH
jgi:uncharacterized membrane protein